MNEILHALAGLITDWGWLVAVAIFFGLGDTVTGRRKIARLRDELAVARAQLAATRAERDRLHNLLSAISAAISSTDRAKPGMTTLAAQARTALDDIQPPAK